MHDLLKYKMANYIKVKKKLPELSSLYHYEEKEYVPTESEKEAERQKIYHAKAKTFWSKKDGGRLMTRRSMEKLLTKLTGQKRFLNAANQP